MSKQLERVAEFEREKEQQAAQLFQQAQLNVNQQKQKLTSLEQYRFDYIRNIQQTGQGGVTAQHYQQHLSFVGKLDKACEQQKVKAVTLLLEKQQRAKQQKEAKAEQAMMDEFATQRFFRAKKQGF